MLSLHTNCNTKAHGQSSLYCYTLMLGAVNKHTNFVVDTEQKNYCHSHHFVLYKCKFTAIVKLLTVKWYIWEITT